MRHPTGMLACSDQAKTGDQPFARLATNIFNPVRQGFIGG